jgi:hypothetical protein
MIFKTQQKYDMLCEQCFLSLKPLNKWRKNFIKDVLWLFLSIIDRVNFSQLARYGKFGEQRYRQQFEKDFDFFGFNQSLVENHCSRRLIIAFDPSYIPKSGKKTAGLGKFWSGCAGKAKWGLEISGIAAIDLDKHTALHLEAIQTIPEEVSNLIDCYAKTLTNRAKNLSKISDTVVADAYFSKEPFVSALFNAGFHTVSRFRDDVRLRYIIEPQKTGKRGRPKETDGPVDINKLNMKYFSPVPQENENMEVYTAVLKAVALKRKLRVVVVRFLKNGKNKTTKIYFSTKTEHSASEILEMYQARFQIEFLYRDAKQFTSLNSCQARDEEKLHFHFNASLTAVNIAKATHWLALPKHERGSFSMSDIKIMNHNALLLNRFISMFAVRPNILKNNQNFKELLFYGVKAA